jgi:hypothetical protein
VFNCVCLVRRLLCLGYNFLCIPPTLEGWVYS